jgi:hypothetical protein
VTAPNSRFALISQAASLETSLTSADGTGVGGGATVGVHTAPLSATNLTVTVITTRACTVAIQVRDDAGTWSTAISETVAIGTNIYRYSGNLGAIRAVATVVGSSAWGIQVYAQAA